ncbi:MAG: xylose isomerase [Phycisphaeraceae bacterium]|nr:xylose isomerase [Phycisphaeraceae bacterium]
MKPWIMFTKHLEGFDLSQIVSALPTAGVGGADLCVRPGYPLTPENCAVELPRAAASFDSAGLTISIVTLPTEFSDPLSPAMQAVFEACGAAGVPFVKLGYWWMSEAGYWATVDDCRRKLEGFEALGSRFGVRALVHNHSGSTMGLNASSVMNLVKGFDPAHIGIYGDVGHLSVVGEPFDMAYSIMKEYLAAVAFKDLVRQRTLIEGAAPWLVDVVPLGRGLADYPLILRQLVEGGFSGPIGFHCEYGGLPPQSIVDQCRIDTRYIQGLLDSEPAA